jgi:hypothetical protein
MNQTKFEEKQEIERIRARMKKTSEKKFYFFHFFISIKKVHKIINLV